jgi:isopentenyl-diphosphate Delta-isomerase
MRVTGIMSTVNPQVSHQFQRLKLLLKIISKKTTGQNKKLMIKKKAMALQRISTFLVSLPLLISFSKGFTVIPSLNSPSTFLNAYGKGMDQDAMMESDMLVVVDENDSVVSDIVVSKRLAHSFHTDQPRGIAHRAFSVFLFRKDRKLLVTRRACSKITFPGVWTNTACSHPLHGMIPSEVDDASVAYPHFSRTKHAVLRKLNHELGIDPQDFTFDQIQFVSRFHYWAADTLTYGGDTPWGEHEIDYVFFIHCKEDEPVVLPNPEEVEEIKYVSIGELKEMFQNPKLRWSPWFRGIMESGGFDWWEDLTCTMEGKNTHSKIHFFDPPIEHWANYNDRSHRRSTGVMSVKTTSNLPQ